MATTSEQPAAELDHRFPSEGATPRPWAEVRGIIEAAEMFWLSTVRRAGRPHVTPLPVMWLDGQLHCCTGPGEQKARNIHRNPACVLTTGTNTFGSGLDVVVEGRAARVTDRALPERLAARWEAKLGWPLTSPRRDFANGPPRSPGRSSATPTPRTCSP